MNRQAAFEGTGRLLKGALHCHTTRSDGAGTPEEVIRLHARHGYDFMALTDHRVYNYENFAGDVPMTLLGGMEMDRDFEGEGVHCHHIVSIGPDRAHGNGFLQDQRFESGRIQRPEQTQEMIDMLHANGNQTIYCHPEWSGTPAREFEMLRGNFAMEIWNTGCAMENDQDTNAAYWDELLMQGQRIYGVATDDGHKMSDHCKGWVRVNAQNDSVSILAALEAGAFYASCGPEIYDFYVEDGVAHVKCSPCEKIFFRYGRWPNHQVNQPGTGPVTEASMKLPPFFTYIRVTLMDAQGRRAWSNPIFLG